MPNPPNPLDYDEIEAKVGDLARALCNPAYSHAENILVAIRKAEADKIPYPIMVDELHHQFIVSTNTPENGDTA